MEVGVELVDVISQVKKQPNATSFTVHINSEGGVVDTGFDIYNYLKSLSVPVKTVGSGLVASIATVIFMAGEQRTLREGTNFMIHLPMGGIDGTADEIEDYAKEVRTVEDKLIKFYSENIGLDKEAIRPLLRNETWLDTVKALELGFSNVQELPMVAKAYFNTNTNNKQMTEADKSWIEKGFEKIINSMKPQIKNIMLQDANGATLEFPDIMEGEEVAVGAVATVDGAPADGEFTMPTGEKYVFTAGELTEIVVTEEGEDDAEDFEAKYNELKAELEAKEQTTAQLETELTEKEAFITNMEKEVKEFKASITSKFDIDGKKDGKKEDGAELSPAQKALNKLKNR